MAETTVDSKLAYRVECTAFYNGMDGYRNSSHSEI